jgi:NSS family neurotransmitter:Na+ symporter
VVSYGVDEWKLSRTKSTFLVGFVIFIVGIPSALCNGANKGLTSFQLLSKGGKGLNWLDSFDYLASNWLLPLGGLFIAVFVGWYLTDEDKIGEFTNISKDSLVYKYIFFSLRYVSPILVGIIMANKIGILSF